jgi:hypothetical protein
VTGTADDRASAAFHIRLTSDERTLLDEKAAAGVTLSQLIRSAVLGYRLPSPPIVREAMGELRRVGVNLNQLRLANTTGDMPALAELRRQCCPSGLLIDIVVAGLGGVRSKVRRFSINRYPSDAHNVRGLIMIEAGKSLPTINGRSMCD